MIDLLGRLDLLKYDGMYKGDFLLTWEKTVDELQAVFTVAGILKNFRERNISCKVFETGLAVSLFKDYSPEEDFAFNAACNMLGLCVKDLNPEKLQNPGLFINDHANLLLPDVVGIKASRLIGKGNSLIREISSGFSKSADEGILPQGPSVLNLGCEIDRPVQAMADMLHILNKYGGTENIKGKKIAVTWEYSPESFVPLSAVQGTLGLMSRFGTDIHFAHPEGYEIMQEIEAIADRNARISGGSFTKSNSREDALQEADIIYPMYWTPFSVMEQYTQLTHDNDTEGITSLENTLKQQNAEHNSWIYGKDNVDWDEILFMHGLMQEYDNAPEYELYHRNLTNIRKQAGLKPYIMAAVIMLTKFDNVGEVLNTINEAKGK